MVDFTLIDRAQPVATRTEGRDATVNAAISAAIRASHGYYAKAVTGDVDASVEAVANSSEYRRFLRAVAIKFTGSPAGSPSRFVYKIPAVEKLFHVWNATSVDCLVRIGLTGGYTIRPGLAVQLYATGSDVIRLNDPQIMTYTEAGSMDGTSDYLMFWRNASLAPARILGNNLGLGGGGGGGPLIFRGSLVYSSVDFTISNDTLTTLSWDTESYDTDGFHSAGAPTQFVVPTGVTMVRLLGSTLWDTNATGYRKQVFQKNGADVRGQAMQSHRQHTGGTINTAYQLSSAPIQVSAGDTLTLAAYQNSGANRTISADSGFSTWFAIMVMES